MIECRESPFRRRVARRSGAALVGLCVANLSACAHYTPKVVAPEATAVELEGRTLAEPALRTYIENATGRRLTEWPLSSWNVDLLTLVAFYYSTDLDVARARGLVADAAIETARSRPNPALALAPEYSTDPPAGISHWMPGLSLDIPVETAGKRRHRISEAQHLAEAAKWSVVTSAWSVRSAVANAILDGSSARRREELLQRRLRSQEQLIRLQEGEVTAGALAKSDTIAARLQAAATRSELLTVQGQSIDARGRLAGALGVPAQSLRGLELQSTPDAPVTSALTMDRARKSALIGRSDVRGALEEYEASQAGLQTQIAKQYPDLHLGPGYKWDQGENRWSLGIGLELPLFNRNRGPIAEAMARREEAAARFLAVQARVIQEVDAATSSLAVAQEAVKSTTDAVELQRQSNEAVRQHVNLGAATSLEQIAAQMELENAEGLQIEALIRQQLAARALENAVQRPLGSEEEAKMGLQQIESTRRAPR